MSHLTKEQKEELKAIIRTGEPIAFIADRLAPMYNKPVHSFRCTLYNLAKRTYKIAQWNGPKKRRTKKNNPPAQIVEKSVTMPQLGQRIERYEDHIRIYF